MNSPVKGVSIIICTYNGSKRLEDVIKHISVQKVDSAVNWELIVVDNASTDNTTDRAKQFWADCGSFPTEFRVLQENKPGVTNARNTGILDARYEYLVFCDDDNWLAPDFVQKAFNILNSDGKIGAVGGNGIAVADVRLPFWFEEYKGYYATGPQGKTSGDISNERAFVYGAGSVFRKSAMIYLRNNGFKNRMMSKTGKSLLTGEDNEYCYALIMAGYKIYYEESLKFQHYMPNARLTIKYFSSLVKAYSFSSFLLAPYEMVIKNEQRPKFKFGSFWNLILILYFIFRYDIPGIPGYIFSGKTYKIKLNWMVRVGGFQAIIKNPGYQLKMYKELRNAPYRKKLTVEGYKNKTANSEFQHN